MLALLGYPTLVEPRLPLQGPAGSADDAVERRLRRARARWRPCARDPLVAAARAARAAAPVRTRRRAPSRARAAAPAAGSRWPSCPSSLLLGATTYITTDLAAVPLLWVLPLALYLLTFILAFAPLAAGAPRVVAAIAPAPRPRA